MSLLKIKESVRDDANSVFHEDQKFFKSDTFESDTIFVTFEIFGKFSESVNFDANNDLQKIWKFSKVTLLKTTKVLYLQEFRTLDSLSLMWVYILWTYSVQVPYIELGEEGQGAAEMA